MTLCDIFGSENIIAFNHHKSGLVHPFAYENLLNASRILKSKLIIVEDNDFIIRFRKKLEAFVKKTDSAMTRVVLCAGCRYGITGNLYWLADEKYKIKKFVNAASYLELAQIIDIPIVLTIISLDEALEERMINFGASINNVSCGKNTVAIIKTLRAIDKDFPIITEVQSLIHLKKSFKLGLMQLLIHQQQMVRFLRKWGEDTKFNVVIIKSRNTLFSFQYNDFCKIILIAFRDENDETIFRIV